jgi:hypothetical protein
MRLLIDSIDSTEGGGGFQENSHSEFSASDSQQAGRICWIDRLCTKNQGFRAFQLSVIQLLFGQFLK